MMTRSDRTFLRSNASKYGSALLLVFTLAVVSFVAEGRVFFNVETRN